MSSGLVVFDLDGTLVDSSTDLAAAVSALVVELGGPPLSRALAVTMVGDGAAAFVSRALAASGLNPSSPGALERYLELYDARLLKTTRLYPGVRAALDALDPLVTLAVLTNKPSAPAERVLTALGVRGAFIEVIGGDGTWPRKPDPAGLRALALHADRGPMLLVGDSPVDAETARRAAVPFVLANYGFGAAAFSSVIDTPYVANAPGHLPDVIRTALRIASAAP